MQRLAHGSVKGLVGLVRGLGAVWAVAAGLCSGPGVHGMGLCQGTSRGGGCLPALRLEGAEHTVGARKEHRSSLVASQLQSCPDSGSYCRALAATSQALQKLDPGSRSSGDLPKPLPPRGLTLCACEPGTCGSLTPMWRAPREVPASPGLSPREALSQETQLNPGLTCGNSKRRDACPALFDLGYTARGNEYAESWCR